jgi:hypothetical protein
MPALVDRAMSFGFVKKSPTAETIQLGFKDVIGNIKELK